MRIVTFLFAILFNGQLLAQDSSIILIKFNKIEKIPCIYKKHAIDKEHCDSAFAFILSKDTFAIPELIKLLVDTSTSKVKNINTDTYYKKGDLALILINYIEWVPFYSITRVQWCICCDCGNMPNGFLQYLDANRPEFQNKYVLYFRSKERRKNIKRDSVIFDK